MKQMSETQAIRSFIMENYLFTDDEKALSNDDSFLEMGILDSTGMLEVIYFLEDDFSIKIEDDEMIPENLDSVNNIIRFLDKKRTQSKTA